MSLPPRAPAWALVALALTALLSARVLAESHAELLAGEAALAHHRPDEALRHLRRAAHLYLPGSPYVRRAYDQLEALARTSETRGQTDQALAAWRAVRSSVLATRWLVVPQRERLARANRRIARLMALLPPPPEDRATPAARLEEKYLALLTEDRSPEPAWVLVMGTGLVLWLASAFWAARHAWDDDDRPRRKALATAGALVLTGIGLFVLGLARA